MKHLATVITVILFASIQGYENPARKNDQSRIFHTQSRNRPIIGGNNRDSNADAIASENSAAGDQSIGFRVARWFRAFVIRPVQNQ